MSEDVCVILLSGDMVTRTCMTRSASEMNVTFV